MIQRLKHYNLKDCLFHIDESWNKVSVLTIMNSWSHTKLISHLNLENSKHEVDKPEDITDMAFDSEIFEQIIEIEKKEDCCVLLDNEEIVKSIKNKFLDNNDSEDDIRKSESETEIETESNQITDKEALQSTEILIK